MPTITEEQLQELNTKVDTAQSTLDTVQQQVANAFAAILAENQALKDELARGGNPETLAAISAKIDVIIADTQTTLPNLPPPDPTPVPDPIVETARRRR